MEQGSKRLVVEPYYVGWWNWLHTVLRRMPQDDPAWEMQGQGSVPGFTGPPPVSR